MKRTALIASLAASLTLTACSGDEPDEEQAAEGSEQAAVDAAKSTPDAPKTDAEGNEIVSEGPGEIYGAPSSGDSSNGDATSASQADASNTAGGSRTPAHSGSATPAGARPSPGSKLQKSDPR